MARFYNLYTSQLDPLDALNGFLQDDYYQTAFAKRLENEQGPDRHQPPCYLDYMLVWLMEGSAGLIFTSFEDWLLAIIRFADDLYSPRVQQGTEYPGAPMGMQEQLGNPRETLDTGLLNWGARSMNETAHHEYADSASAREFYLPADADGMNHPALDRNVFERCRAHALRMEQFDQFQELRTNK